MENNNTEPENAQQSSLNPVDDFNLGLFIYIVNKSVVWLVFIVIICVTLSIIYLRYAPRIYNSSTTLMLKTEKTTQILGVQNIVVEQDETEISREMRLLKSKLLIERIIGFLPLQVGYYKEGKTKFIFTELYTSSPFEVEGKIKDKGIINTPIYVKIYSQNKIYIGFSYNGKEFEYSKDTGKVISNPYFTASIHLRRNVTEEDYSGIYYFKFQDKTDLVEDIANKLEVLPIDPKTKTIGLVYKDRNPARAHDVVSAVAKQFIAYDVERKKESILNILDFIQNQIDTFGFAYDKYQDSVSTLRISDGYIDKGVGYLGQLSDRLVDYEQKFRDFEYDITLLQTFKILLATNKEYANLPSLKFKVAPQDFSGAVTTINTLQQSRNLMLLDATPQHPNVRMTDRQIEDTKTKLNKDVDNTINGLKTSLTLLRQEYRKYLDEIMRIPGLQNKFARLDKMAEVKNDFILNLYEQLSNYLIASAGIVSDYVILEKANLPVTPVSPKETFVKIAGFAVGLLLGLLLIIVRYLLHNTIISIEDVERKTKAPLLGVIPRHKEEMLRSQIVVTQDPKATITEAFRAVRANLQFISSAPGPKVVSTTSTIPGEGKTFVSLNIAAILSLLNKKVIILDFDMRKPRLDKIFEVDSHRGVSTILSGQTPIADCIMESGIPNLHFITSGPVPPNPSELILLPRLKEMVKELKENYDYIVIDTPPIGLVTDALEILKLSDYPIYILRAAYSNRNFVHGINRIMTESKIKNLSTVINDYGRGASGYGYSYGYNYGYGYYGKKYGEGYYTTESKPKTSWLKKLFE